VPDIDYGDAVVVIDTDLQDESPILDLRVRKAIRRFSVEVVLVGGRPGALDPPADAIVRTTPDGGEAALAALAAALAEVEPVRVPPSDRRVPRDPAQTPPGGLDERQHGEPERQGESAGTERIDDLARRAGTSAEAVRNAAAVLRAAGPIVVLWGERLSDGPRGRQGVAALLALARALEIPETEGSGLIEIPSGTNARGLREAGCLPGLGPGLLDAPQAGRPAAEIAAALGDDLSALVLLNADPLRTHPDRAGWKRALEAATFVAAFADFESETVAEHADVVFPAESYAEREGTVTHADGRLQRVRQSIAHPGEVRPVWSVLAELGARLGAPADPPFLTSPMVTRAITEAVPFLAGLTLEELSGKGKRWQERDAAEAAPEAPSLPQADELEEPPEPVAPSNGDLRLGTTRSLWAGRETERAPILRFLAPHQRVELSPQDGRALGVESGDEVEVSRNGSSVRGIAALRDALPPRSVYLIEGTAQDSATELLDGESTTVTVRRVEAE
ncbi:MAG TPA: molybdopterin-dependent oxidoreductase, partial [Thermoleophilaceae bacterium]|nr:molybdopterin-dependent oxidoreductase [Thermoleophilaceae bacterium]